MISVIAAVSRNNVIGRDNKIPWRLSGDLARFKQLTKLSDWYVMGRKSYESIVDTLKDKTKEPLPGRKKVVLTRNPNFNPLFCSVTTSPEFILNASKSGLNIFIGGGEEIYRIFLPHAERFYLTRVHANVEGDAFFPEWDPNDWFEHERESVFANPQVTGDEYNYDFIDYIRKPRPVYIEMENVRGEEQRKVMQEILERGHCPFCEENLLLYHKAPIFWRGKNWIVTQNQWPYRDKKQHFMLILRRHAVSLKEINAEEWEELGSHLHSLESEFGIKGGALAMRFGDMKLSGATVAHIHAQIIEPLPTAPEPVHIWLGPKQKPAAS